MIRTAHVRVSVSNFIVGESRFPGVYKLGGSIARPSEDSVSFFEESLE